MDQKIWRVKSVRVDSIVAMKLMKLANENPTEQQSGYLLGIIDDDIIEVTNSYPILPDLEMEEQEKADEDMLEYSRRHNLDNNKVGLYIISDQHKQFNLDFFEELNSLQFYVKYAFVLIYSLNLQQTINSPYISKTGQPQPFIANIINEKYSELYSKEDLNASDLQALNLKHDKLYKTVPVELLKTPLTQAFLFQYGKQIEEKYQNCDTKYQSNLNNNGKVMIENIDDLIQASEKLNQENKKKGTETDKSISAADLMDYLIQLNKVNYISETIRKDASFIIKTEPYIQSLLK